MGTEDHKAIRARVETMKQMAINLGGNPDCRQAATDLTTLLAENVRLRGIEIAAHFILVSTYQGDIVSDPQHTKEAFGGWRVSDLHPSVWNKMTSAEQDLHTALTRSAALKGETDDA